MTRPRPQKIARILFKNGKACAETVFTSEGTPDLPAPPLPEGLEEGSFLSLSTRGWEVLAPAGGARAALYEILATHKISPLFPAEVHREVALWQEDPEIDDPSLKDYTRLPFVTIDNDDSRDLDQALCIERSKDGGFVVWYALADASHYVRAGSALFREALARGSSYYLPRMGAPMLPRALSEDLVSLNPNVDRRALVFRMHLCPQGVHVDTTIKQGKIHSRAKLTYKGVQAYHDDKESSPLREQDYTETLDLLRDVGELRISEAQRRDVVRYDRAHVSVNLRGEDIKTFGAAREERNDVERWNEQVSLLCNAEGALFLKEKAIEHPHVQPIFRIHDEPSPQRLGKIRGFIKDMIRLHHLDAAIWTWNPPRDDETGESVAEYLARLPREGSNGTIRAAIERQFLLANTRSVFSEDPGKHFALGVESYSRFSAPMREVVGVFIHKEALEKLYPLREKPSNAEDEKIREQVIAAAHQARKVQRKMTKEVQKLAIDQLLRDDLQLPQDQRPVREGVIHGIRGSKLYVSLQNPPMEIKVYLQDQEFLAQHRFSSEQGGAALYHGEEKVPIFRVGDVVALRTDDYRENRWVLTPVWTLCAWEKDPQ